MDSNSTVNGHSHATHRQPIPEIVDLARDCKGVFAQCSRVARAASTDGAGNSGRQDPDAFSPAIALGSLRVAAHTRRGFDARGGLVMHEVKRGRWASEELLRGRLRGVRRRREPAPIDTTRGPAHGAVNGLVAGFAMYAFAVLAIAVALWWSR